MELSLAVELLLNGAFTISLMVFLKPVLCVLPLGLFDLGLPFGEVDFWLFSSAERSTESKSLLSAAYMKVTVND